MNYKKISTEDIDFFRGLLGEQNVFIGDSINEDFYHDEFHALSSTPEILVSVENREQVSEILKYANKNLIPVTPRGQGSGMVGAAVSILGGIMIDMRKMNRILEFDSSNMTLTVEAGVLLIDIISYLDGSGYFYSPDPGEKSATIGGNINTNAGGMKAVKYGSTRENVLGIEIVYPNGTIDFLGGKTVKNSSGYSILDLIIGSEGTLGVVTKAVLKLSSVPTYSVSLLIPFNSLETAIEIVPKIVASKLAPTAVEFIEREVILDAEKYLGKKFPHNSANAYLLVSIDAGSKNEIENYWEELAELCVKNGAIDVFLADSDERKSSLWKIRGMLLEAITALTTELDECDAVVPRDKIPDFIKFTDTLKHKYNVRIKSFGHAGDGNVHINILRDGLSESEWKEKQKAVFEELYQKALTLGGEISGEHGVGFAKKAYLKKSISSYCLEIHKKIKLAFDPNLILNPGKVFDIV